MKRKRIRGVPVTIDYFSKNFIAIRSRHNRALLVVLPALAGVFLLIFGATCGLTATLISTAAAFILILVGFLLLGTALWLRHGAWQIIIDGTHNSILGLRNITRPVLFSEIEGIDLLPNDLGDGWTLTLNIRSSGPAVVLYDYPIDPAMHIGEHLSRLLARPMHCHPSLASHPRPVVNWSFPYKMPGSRFPFTWLILSGALAALIPVATSFLSLGPFDPLVMPRWFIIAAVALSGIAMVSDTYNRFDITLAGVAAGAVILLLLLGAVIALNHPAGASLWLFPGLSAALLTGSAAARGKRIALWIVITLICLIPGVIISGEIIYQHYSFKHLDPGVLESITIDTTTGEHLDLKKPRDILEFLSPLQSAGFYTRAYQPRKPLFTAVLHRPFGTDYMLKVRSEGQGGFRQTVCLIYGELFHRPIRIATLATQNAQEHFIRIKPLRRALMPSLSDTSSRGEHESK